MHTIRNILRIIITLFACISFAQLNYGQTYEIRAVNKGQGIIGVEARVTAGNAPTNNDYVTDITFGLKWSATYNVDLAAAITTSFNIQKAGNTTSKNGYNFQSFYSEPVGYKLPMSWQLNNWVEIMSIANNKMGNGNGLFEICEVGFDATTGPNLGINFVDFTPVINGQAMNVPLPVKLMSFEVKAEKKLIRLEWSTVTEQNNKGFEVQRSQGEVNEYKAIGWIEGSGYSNTTNRYSFLDKAVQSKVKYLYRLRQVDKQDNFSYSEIKPGVLEEADKEGIRIAPNPAKDVLQLYFNSEVETGKISVKVLDTKSGIVLSKEYIVDAGKQININVLGLTNGQYYLVVEKNKKVLYSKAFQKR